MDLQQIEYWDEFYMDNRGPQYAKISLELPEPIISAFRVACFAYGTAGALNVATRYSAATHLAKRVFLLQSRMHSFFGQYAKFYRVAMMVDYGLGEQILLLAPPTKKKHN